ncbi:unnamed protein product, partial [Rotaria sp. Silwood2]
LNEEIYDRLHKRLLHQPTRREKQLNMMLQDPIESPTVLQPRIWDNNVMYPRYRYDSSIPIDFPKIFYQWWRTYFGNNVSIMKNVKVRLVTSTNPTLETFMIHKKPPREMLTKMENS